MEDKEKKQYLKKIFEKRLHPNKSLSQKQQFEHIVHKETIDSEYKYEQTTKKLLHLDIGICPECDNTTYCIDYHRGERVCPQCGFVFSNTVFETPRHPPIPKFDKNTIPKKEKYPNNKRYLYMTEAAEWKKRQIQREIDVVVTSLQMSHYNKKRLEDIINTCGLKKLHRKADMTTIICAVARYLIKNQKHKPLVYLRYDRGIFKESLTKEEYLVVEKNITKIFGDTYDYIPSKKKPHKRKNKNKKHFKNKSRRAKRNR